MMTSAHPQASTVRLTSSLSSPRPPQTSFPPHHTHGDAGRVLVDHALHLPIDRLHICHLSLLRDGKIGFLFALIILILLLTGDR